MRAKFLAILSPPDLGDRATMLNAILLAASLGLACFFLIGQLAGAILVPNTEVTLAALVGVMTVLLILVRRGHAQAAGVLLLVFGWMALSYQAWITGGLRGTAFFANALVILAASLLVGTKTAIVFTISGIASAWFFAVAESRGVLETYAAPPLLAAFEMTLVLGLVTVLAYLLIRNLARALENARESNRQLQTFSSTLEEEVVARTRSTEAARAEAEAAKKEMEARVWLTTRQARLSDRMRGEQEVVTLAMNVIKQLCHDVGAVVGALYLVEGDVLQLTGSYALENSTEDVVQFKIGSGLVGQAVLDKEAITLTNVPENYLTVTSGLGRGAPRAISAIPFFFEAKPIGVVELATLAGFDALQLEYLHFATENIAIAVNTARTRDRLNELLSETQAQAETLKAQEEKLRATNEELEGQTSSLRRSETQLRQQQQDLEAANAKLERTADVLRKQQETLDDQNRTLRAARAELEERATQLERASRYKSEFLANMSHELRTPLNSLLILARMLAENGEENLTPDQVEAAQIVHSSGQDLLNLINDILDLSKIEAGKMVFQIAPVAVDDFVQSMRQQFSHVANERQLTFRTRVDAAAAGLVQTDRQRIEQILRNLLSNAFKFTETGSVSLIIEPPTAADPHPSGLPQDAACIAFRVVDTGIGMTPAQQAIVFEGFQQADGSTSRKYGGTGLGLTISRELVSHLNGCIALESEPGRGSTFSIILPIWNKSQKEPDRPGSGSLRRNGTGRGLQSSSLQGVADAGEKRGDAPATTTADDREQLDPQKRHLLIIEDDIHFARIIRDEAQGNGMQCLIAHDGEDGLLLSSQFKPDAIILDLSLPDMSGWDVMRQLKSAPGAESFPIHIISVEDVDLDAFRWGAIGFLTKPVRRDELSTVFDNIESFIARAERNVLIIQRDDVTRLALSAQLRSPSLVVDAVANGSDARLLLLEKRFDCVIIDLDLADINGFELLKQISAQRSHRDCPVIVYSRQDLTAAENGELLVYADNVIVEGESSETKVLQETVRILYHVGVTRRGTGPLEGQASSLPQPYHNGVPQKPVAASAAAKSGGQVDAHVLVVDDDVRNAFALSRLLSNRGLRVTVARSGSRALEILDEQPDINLILMDIMMPEMDGYEAMSRIRSLDQFGDVAIIALTAHAMIGDREKCLAAGADDYLAKPVQTAELYSRIQHWLSDAAKDTPNPVGVGE